MACIFHNKPCVFFASKRTEKINGENAVFGTSFCLAAVLAAHGLPKHLSERAESQPDHAIRYRRGGLMPSNTRISPTPRMGIYELIEAYSETQSPGAELHKQKSPSCSTRDGEQTIALIICQRLNASLSSFIDSSLMPSGSNPMHFAS